MRRLAVTVRKALIHKWLKALGLRDGFTEFDLEFVIKGHALAIGPVGCSSALGRRFFGAPAVSDRRLCRCRS